MPKPAPIPKGATIGPPMGEPIPPGATIGAPVGGAAPEASISATPLGQRSYASRLRDAYPGFTAAHPSIMGAAGDVANFLQGAGREIGSQVAQLGAAAAAPVNLQYSAPTPTAINLTRNWGRNASKRQMRAKSAYQPVLGNAEGLGRGAADMGEFVAADMLGGAPEEAIGEAMEGAPKAIRMIAQLAPKAATNAAASKLQGGNPWLGAAIPVASEGVEAIAQRLAPGIAENAIGIRRVDRGYGKTPGRALLDETKGLRPATVAASASDATRQLDQQIARTVEDASRARLMRDGRPSALALPPGPAERIAVPLHEASAVVDQPGIAQPAMREGSYQTSLYPYRPVYKTDTAMANVGGTTARSANEGRAVDAAQRLAENNGSEFVRPGAAPLEHPMARPLNVVRKTEPAQGVWMRAPDELPSQPGTLPPGLSVERPQVSLLPAKNSVEDRLAKENPQYSPKKVAALRRVAKHLGQFPDSVSPAEALAIKRGVREEFANYAVEPGFDTRTASTAAKEAAHGIDAELDRSVPGFHEANQRYSSLIDVRKRAGSASREAPLSQRLLHRVGAHTGALIGAGAGAEIGYRKDGLEGAVAGGLAGGIIPELIASPTGQIALARTLNAAPSIAKFVRPAVQTAASLATRKKAPAK